MSIRRFSVVLVLGLLAALAIHQSLSSTADAANTFEVADRVDLGGLVIAGDAATITFPWRTSSDGVEITNFTKSCTCSGIWVRIEGGAATEIENSSTEVRLPPRARGVLEIQHVVSDLQIGRRLIGTASFDARSPTSSRDPGHLSKRLNWSFRPEPPLHWIEPTSVVRRTAGEEAGSFAATLRASIDIDWAQVTLAYDPSYLALETTAHGRDLVVHGAVPPLDARTPRLEIAATLANSEARYVLTLQCESMSPITVSPRARTTGVLGVDGSWHGTFEIECLPDDLDWHAEVTRAIGCHASVRRVGARLECELTATTAGRILVEIDVGRRGGPGDLAEAIVFGSARQ